MRLRRRSTSRFSSCVSAHACVSRADEAAFQSKCTSARVRTASRPSFAALSAPRDVILTPDLSAHDDVVWFAWLPTRNIDVQRGCNAASAKLPPLIAARISKAGDCTPGGFFVEAPLASASASARLRKQRTRITQAATHPVSLLCCTAVDFDELRFS